MARSLRYLLLLLFTFCSLSAFAQEPGSISGVAKDENNETMMGVIVEVSSGGLKRGGAATDADGEYTIKPLPPGEYLVIARYPNYPTLRFEKVMVSPNGNATVNLNFKPNTLDEIVVIYEKPLIDERGGGGRTIGGEAIQDAPTRDIAKIVATVGGIRKDDRSNSVNSAGSRGSNTITVLDGMVLRGGIPNLSPDILGEVEVELGGMSARSGDATGAVVRMTTRGPSSRYTGALNLEKSVEGFGHNLGTFTLSGPLAYRKKRDAEGKVIDKKPVLGFLFNAEAWYDKNRNPSYNGNWVVKDDVRERLEARPLVLAPNTVGTPVYNYATEFVTKDDLKNVKVMPNAAIFEGRAFAKLDYQLSDNMNVTAGANINYTKGSALANGGSYSSIMFTPEAIPVTESFNGRAYLRFTQRFSKNANDTGNKSRIQNAYYSLQADYVKDYSNTEDPNHGRNLFNYGYVGRFTQNRESRYTYDVDTNTGTRLWKLVSYDAPTSYTYEASDLNPTLSNYTTQFYQLGNLPPTITELRGQRGLANGDFPASVYGIYPNIGNTLTGYGYANSDQIAAQANASFDLMLGKGAKKRHAIEFGLYYQQSTSRSYNASANLGRTNSIWEVMRSLTNSHITLDYNNPLYNVNGQTYTLAQIKAGAALPGIFDTMFFNRLAIDTVQTNFDRNLRAKLGLPVNGTDIVTIDSYDPSTFSLDMFSADELVNGLGSPLVSYFGYDYLGNRLKGQVNFNDYFTEKDAQGNFTRNIGAYRPNYIAGYILDRFKFKDISFNIGLRVDRYDLNTKVLKDPYSLYETYKVSDRNTAGFQARGSVPGNIGEDYVVYVDNNQSSSPTIIGYRNGDDWYNASGQFIQDPTALRAVSGRDPQPYLTEGGRVLITDTTSGAGFDPTRSFTDYKPQTSLSPRIAFQFPISEQSLFYAHYDILVQRPTAGVYATPYDYYYMTQNTGAINNPNLRPEKTFDYEFGFSQTLSRKSVISLAGTYKERKDQIQLRPYLYAWPQTYYSYGNRDYSTTKAFYVKYELRRVNNLRLLLNYTLQFVEGTGSNANSSGNGLLQTFIASSLPNLRTVMPLDQDNRHMINATIDYRFVDNLGPKVNGKAILENLGINLLFTSRSGEPYTRYQNPIRVSNTVKGELNGSRLPWHYMLDLRVDKDFTLSVHKQDPDAKAAGKPARRNLYVNAYCYINNVLNTRDVLSVDGFTGRPDDDGYLVSPQGQLQQQVQTSAVSYADLYTISLMNPYRINMPRRINFGLSLNF
ncbi:MAG: carboxypeptidase regulatory-like domain-containing protein [Flavipsychrobacter sp.]|nr:carboxypeptidase regulatory-like domain-containing protein [Flavipsychrobacter sp.]